jgi:predicted metalloprotease
MLNTLPDIFAALIATIQEKGKWAYQEGIVDLLAADIHLRSKACSL